MSANLHSSVAMARKHLIRTSEFPYHLCARSNNREWFDVPLEQCWEIYKNCLSEVQDKYGFVTHDFVLMSNHWHWIASTPQANLDDGMRFFMTETSRKIARAAGRINRIYGSRYSWTVIGTPDHYGYAYRYVLMNPVKAKICESPFEYPWSTLNNKLIKTVICEGFSCEIPTSPSEFWHWLMELKDADKASQVKLALRRAIFTMPRDPRTKRKDPTRTQV